MSVNLDNKQSRGESFLEELETHVEDVLSQHPEIQAETAQALAVRVVDRIWKAWGGIQLYISKERPYLERRNEEIFEAFQGDNYDDLARRYDLSVIRIRGIIKAVRARRTAAKTHTRKRC